MKKKISSYISFWHDVLSLLRYAEGRLTFLVFIVAVLEAILGIAMLFAIKVLVGSVAQQGSSEADPFNSRTLFALGLTLAALIFGKLLASFGNYLRAKQSLLVADVVNEEIQRRTVAADLSFFDSALYYDALERAREVGAQRPAEVISNALTCLRSLILLLGIGVVIVGLDWRILPGIALALALTLIVQLQTTGMRFRWITQRIQLERKAAYLDWLVTSEQYAKEVRLFHIGDNLRRQFRGLRDTIREAQIRIEWVRASRETMIALIGGLVFIGSAYLVATSAPDNATALSALVLLVVAFQRAEAAGRSAVQSLSRLYDDRLFLGQLFQFLAIEPTIKVPAKVTPLPDKLEDGLRLTNIQFSYPRSATPALKGVSLHLPPGKFIALVGGNGSGKSSLIKVMCRLYDAQDGQITLDGEDIRNFDPVAYRRQFGVVFQDFGHYAFTARENIHLGDLMQPADGPRMTEAARLAGAHEIIEALPKGYDTMLVRMFDDGQELSGGQWQRVALARAFFPQSRFLVLDEPTSATDPSAESALFDRFREKLGDRSALVISHRLSTIRSADYTYVLDKGRIVEEGRHEDLVAAKGRYYTMFKAQMPD
ncbi:ABC transporter ATP-binding protein [Tritonibacter horizontis]|uniref:Putative multidrug export ATP-binding/permease protein n=1 Tax=Tritonibacter horizontis TaxID=1768241 RepID=A0A132BYU0_9RHOB|nr:ABC transporter ATP-binding protein [Tritonibacter horizontis]KUP93529.1 putative multidrug export ATP-binding/permease protein [Tritonibacter horizontis]